MGVVHMLVVALVGITYGWQGDGNGGVEYIVQISPAELKEIDRIGEITSSIDPAVAGHVSRIKIVVGSGTLPRETPVHLSQQRSGTSRAGVATAPDRIAVPIPEMREQDLAAPIRSLDHHDLAFAATESQQVQASMMKPDPDNANPGYSFPSTLGDTANNTAQGVRSDLDRAGREIAGRGQNLLQDLRENSSNAFGNSVTGTGAPGTGQVAPPATWTPDGQLQPTLPQFTTGPTAAGPTATTRSGGPTTEPTQKRDQVWTDFAGPRSGGPTTDAIGTDRSLFDTTRTSDPTFNGPTSNDQRLSNSQFSAPRSGVGMSGSSVPGDSATRSATGTFGQVPGGITFPNRGSATDPRLTLDRNGQRNDSTNRYGRDPILSQQQQTEMDRQNRTIPASEFAGESSIRDRSRESLQGNTIGLPNRETANSQFSNGPIALNPAQNNPAQNNSQSGPDRRLTNAELDAGAWWIDRYGRLLDRSGKLIPPVAKVETMRDPRNDLVDRYGNHPSGARLAEPMVNRTNPNFVDDRQTHDPNAFRGSHGIPYQQTKNRLATNTRAFNEPELDRMRTAPEANQIRDPVSLTKRDPDLSGTTGIPISKTARNHIAAQPLFNGLLLMSFVANIYLMFWLKNLRLRFRDLVAAKRLASPSSQAS